MLALQARGPELDPQDLKKVKRSGVLVIPKLGRRGQADLGACCLPYVPCVAKDSGKSPSQKKGV